MPKDNRLADTIGFLRGVSNPDGSPVHYGVAVADLLESFGGNIPAPVVSGMSMGRVGTEETRKYRRAMILMLCVIKNTSIANAKAAVGLVTDANLHAALGQMLRETAVNYGGRVFNPLADQLLANPLAFLTNNRIKLGRGQMVNSGPTDYELSYQPNQNLYLMEPPNILHHYVHTNVPGFNVHVQMYTAVKDELHDITGVAVAGNLAVTTQLSGCTVIYRVNGGNLTVAHIQPEAAVSHMLPQDLAQFNGSPSGVLLFKRMVRDGNLGGGGAGTLGIFGMVGSTAETGLQFLGTRRVRAHGYTDTWGNAYFLGVRVGGNWQIFAQQNNPGQPHAGVSNIMRLYP